MSVDHDTAVGHELEQFINGLRKSMTLQYTRGVNKDLSRQYWMGLFQRNFRETVYNGLGDTLRFIQQHPARQDFRAQVIPLWQKLLDEFLDFTLQHNRSSCAISNFADEHKPSEDYVATVLKDSEAMLRSFESSLQQQT